MFSNVINTNTIENDTNQSKTANNKNQTESMNILIVIVPE